MKAPKPKRVNFHANPDDMLAAVMGSFGYSTDYISQMTGLSPGQVGYRLKLGQVKRADYRNGTSTVAGLVFRTCKQEVRYHLAETLPEVGGTVVKRKRA